MKELLLQFAAYNLWANQLFGERLISLPEEKQKQTVASSFDSLLKTVVHMWDAEAIWWQRLKLQERIVVPSATFTGNMKEAFDNLLKQDRQWKEWVEKAQ
ncbi:MAG: DinB family protein, partial [Flavisolibacter sp.]